MATATSAHPDQMTYALNAARTAAAAALSVQRVGRAVDPSPGGSLALLEHSRQTQVPCLTNITQSCDASATGEAGGASLKARRTHARTLRTHSYSYSSSRRCSLGQPSGSRIDARASGPTPSAVVAQQELAHAMTTQTQEALGHAS